MTTVFDVADYIAVLRPSTRTDRLKLQKLVYYSQAWSLAWDKKPLFTNTIQAWKNGPVAVALYRLQRHDKGEPGSIDALSPEGRATISAVVDAFGDRSADWLSALAHRERPWIDARQGLPPEARCENEITIEAMREWYCALPVPPKSFPPAYIRGLEVLVETPQSEIQFLTAPDAVRGDAYLKWLEDGDASWPE